MTRVCLVGDGDVTLRYELLSRETAREALATYDLHEPFDNAVGLETVSLGAAVALLNDLDWYLARFADEAMVLEPSVSGEEWLSRDLATAVRDDAVDADEVDRFLKVYGLAVPDGETESGTDSPGPASRAGEEATTEPSVDSLATASAGEPQTASTGGESASPKRLVEPMFVTRTGEDIPGYDLRNVDETVVERVTESEFGA